MIMIPEVFSFVNVLLQDEFDTNRITHRIDPFCF